MMRDCSDGDLFEFVSFGHPLGASCATLLSSTLPALSLTMDSSFLSALHVFIFSMPRSGAEARLPLHGSGF